MINIKKQLIQAYDKDAKRRDEAEGKRDDWKLAVREKFINLLTNEAKKTVLELGAGAGLDSEYFKQKGFEVLATDLSAEMIKMCKKRGLKAEVIDLYNLKTLGRKFDAIFSLNVLLHVPKKDLSKVLDVIADVLNPNGIFFYGVYGGVSEEKTIIDKNKMGLPRFFSFLSDDDIRTAVKKRFDIIDFEAISVEGRKPDIHFQSLFLRLH